ncbi:MAG TPA: hypothetical protein VFI03_12230 [Solirubrobacterales bacterium]|nr:hypothetical protein [Solirubrobacterales bacterium]
MLRTQEATIEIAGVGLVTVRRTPAATVDVKASGVEGPGTVRFSAPVSPGVCDGSAVLRFILDRVVEAPERPALVERLRADLNARAALFNGILTGRTEG